MSEQKIEIPETTGGAQAPEAPGAVGPATPAAAPAPPAPSTPEQLEELKAKAIKADEHWERLLRVAADFENFKKRAARERQEAVKYAQGALLEKLIPVLDNFDAAVAAAQQANAQSVESLRAGIAMIYNQLKNVLSEAGLEEVIAANQPFDPNLHEAVAHQETSN